MTEVLKANGEVYVKNELDDCPHIETEEIQGAGPTPLREICVECKKEL